MSNQFRDCEVGAFIKALRQEQIDCILIGAMAAVHHGAPCPTIDYDFWVRLPERQYVRFLTIARRLGGKIMARTLYERKDGRQVNVIFHPDGLQSFETEYKRCTTARMGGQRIKILPLRRVIASKRASNREKDLAVLPILERQLRCQRRTTWRRK